VRRALLVALPGLAACSAPEGGRAPDLGLAASFLPNLGLAASTSLVVRRSPELEQRLEARFTDQFVDDKAVADNDVGPAAGDWTQLELGWLGLGQPDERSHWIWRLGALGFQARGQPNIVSEPGDYLGVYAGLGRETSFGRGFAIGPAVALIAASGPDDFVLVPQITWGLRWCPARR
jgi:hypothetical protein